MRARLLLRVGAAAIWLLAGCSDSPLGPSDQRSVSTGVAGAAALSWGDSTVVFPASRRFPLPAPGSALPDSSGPPVIMTAQTYHNDLNVYRVHPPRDVVPALSLTFEESITTGLNQPSGAVGTTSGHVYVTNFGSANIVVFAYVGTNYTIIKTLTDPGERPLDVDSNASENLIAVSNALTTTSSPGSISLYAHGSTTPTGTLTVGGSPVGLGIAIDRIGNCFWGYAVSPSSSNIVEFPKCKGTAVPIVSGVGQAGGLAFDAKNNLFYTDQLAGHVYKCVGTSSCSVLASGFNRPVFINFDLGWKHLWLTDPNTATIYALNPKTGKVLLKAPAHGGAGDPPFGIAADPGAKY